MLYEEFVKNNKSEFLNSVWNVSDLLGIDPNWLMTVMYKESGINPQAVNKNGGATGLIQFMPATARALGTTTAKLYSMNNVEQLYYVYQYFKPYRGRLKSYTDLYLACFFPLALGKPDDWIISSGALSADKVATANPVIDLNKDKAITVGEFREYCYKGLSPQALLVLKKKAS